MIYIQSNEERTLPHHFDCACALYGAIDRGLEYKLISYDDLISGRYDPLFKKRLFVGSVEFLSEIFRRIGVSPRVPVNSNRISEEMSLGEAVKRIENGEKLFIKPKQIKLFTGMVTDTMTLSCLKPYPNDARVWVYKPFESPIKSEWRCYVLDGRVRDIRNYSGDIWELPDYNFVGRIIQEYRDVFPSAFTIDVGILESGENVVIEFNDMWAIGNYGMENSIYLRMLRERWFEIMRGINAEVA